MGLDIGLGVFVLLAGIRGWFRGFVLQTVQLVAVVGAVFAAGPLRDQVRPYAVQYLPGMEPQVLSKLLWWSAAVLTYVLGSGIAASLIRLHRKRNFAEFEPNRGDQGAGFVLGAAKGAVVCAFALAGVSTYAPQYTPGGLMADQVKASRALVLNGQYRPAAKIWASAPVKAVVAVVRHEGLGLPVEPNAEKPAIVDTESRRETVPATAGADRLRPLVIPRPAPALDPRSPRFLDEMDAAMQQEGLAKSR